MHVKPRFSANLCNYLKFCDHQSKGDRFIKDTQGCRLPRASAVSGPSWRAALPCQMPKILTTLLFRAVLPHDYFLTPKIIPIWNINFTGYNLISWKNEHRLKIERKSLNIVWPVSCKKIVNSIQFHGWIVKNPTQLNRIQYVCNPSTTDKTAFPLENENQSRYHSMNFGSLKVYGCLLSTQCKYLLNRLLNTIKLIKQLNTWIQYNTCALGRLGDTLPRNRNNWG